MSTASERLKTLAIGELTNALYKIGGQCVGNYQSMNITELISKTLSLFELLGRPAGFVFSAPAGLTRELHELFELSNMDGAPQDKILTDLFQIIEKISDQANEMLKLFSSLVPSDQAHEYNISFEKLKIGVASSAINFNWQIERSMSGDIEFEKAFAFMVSLGEKAPGEMIIEPLCRILTKFFHINFFYLDPSRFITPRYGSRGYRDLEPDIDASVVNLRKIITEVQEMVTGKVTFVMPGFYMGSSTKGCTGIMPYNGSDISAYILSLALSPMILSPKSSRTKLLYIKDVIGEMPADLMSLRRIQDRKNQEIEGRKEELIAGFVLDELIRDKQGLEIFDTNTQRVFAVPAVSRNTKLTVVH